MLLVQMKHFAPRSLAASTMLRVPSTLSRVCSSRPPDHQLVLPAT